jgi:hypothetical protein
MVAADTYHRGRLDVSPTIIGSAHYALPAGLTRRPPGAGWFSSLGDYSRDKLTWIFA